MSIFNKLKQNKKIKDIIVNNVNDTTVSEFYHSGSITLNLLLSGKVNGGIPRGKYTMLAAPRGHGKTVIAMISAGNAQKKDCKVIWIDSEFAFDPVMATMFGLDTSQEKFLLVQENGLEEIQTFVANISQDYDEKTDGKLFIVIDSLGTMITSKVLADAVAGEDKADMQTSKKKNSLSRIMLRMAGINNIPVVAINHLYEDMKQYSTGAIAGGSSGQYVASSILKITSKAKEKDDDTVIGNSLTAYTDKGRIAREHSRLKFMISYDGGINPYYGLLDDALEGGYIIKPSSGWYARAFEGSSASKFRESQIYNKDFFNPIFKNTDFKNYLETKYSYQDLLSGNSKVYNTVLEDIEKD